jgi:hypothetical protein
MAKSAVLKPMPIASEATATAVNPGLLSSHRTAYRMSARRDSSKTDNYNPGVVRIQTAISPWPLLFQA